MSQVLEQLARTGALAALPTDHLRTVAALAHPVSVAAGEYIARADRPSAYWYAIVEGQVGLQVRGPDGRIVEVETLGPGDALGWSWLTVPYRWKFDAIALTPVTALAVDAVRLRRLCDTHPDLGYAVLRGFLPVIADRLQHARARLAEAFCEHELAES
jgi:CRP-like cAMP-binding protein